TTLDCKIPRERYQYVASASSPDGRWLAAGAMRRSDTSSESSADTSSSWICLWDASGNFVTRWDAKQTTEFRLSFSLDGNRLVTLSYKENPRLWSVPEGVLLAEVGYEPLLGAAFWNRRPYLVTNDSTGAVRTYDARTGDLLATGPGTLHVDRS